MNIVNLLKVTLIYITYVYDYGKDKLLRNSILKYDMVLKRTNVD